MPVKLPSVAYVNIFSGMLETFHQRKTYNAEVVSRSVDTAELDQAGAGGRGRRGGGRREALRVVWMTV